MLPQTYLDRRYCWNRRSIQTATDIHAQVEAFMAKHPEMLVFSGLRRLADGDHRCGLAVDIVPRVFSDQASAKKAYNDAIRLQNLGRVAYVEPFALTWTGSNHHVHISFRRCPRTLVSRAAAAIRRLARRP